MGVLAVALLAGTWSLMRTDGRDGAARIWPALLIGVALVTPLGWLYYFILPLAASRLGGAGRGGEGDPHQAPDLAH